MKTAIVLHHTGTSGNRNQYDSVLQYHNAGAGGKWPAGHGIQYAHFIDKDGTDRQGRDESETTWHAGSNEWNTKSIAVCLAGDFRYEMPAERHIEELTRVLMDIQSRHGIPDSEIYLHGEVRSTTCPGTDLRAKYFAYRASRRLPATYSAEAQLKRLRRAINRAIGYTKVMLERQLERLLERVNGRV